jgi:hypothetical protein
MGNQLPCTCRSMPASNEVSHSPEIFGCSGALDDAPHATLLTLNEIETSANSKSVSRAAPLIWINVLAGANKERQSQGGLRSAVTKFSAVTRSTRAAKQSQSWPSPQDREDGKCCNGETGGGLRTPR